MVVAVVATGLVGSNHVLPGLAVAKTSVPLGQVRGTGRGLNGGGLGMDEWVVGLFPTQPEKGAKLVCRVLGELRHENQCITCKPCQ